MDHNYMASFEMDDQHSDLMTYGFTTINEQQMTQVIDPSIIPKVLKKDTYMSSNKDQDYGIKLQTYGFLDGNQPESVLSIPPEEQNSNRIASGVPTDQSHQIAPFNDCNNIIKLQMLDCTSGGGSGLLDFQDAFQSGNGNSLASVQESEENHEDEQALVIEERLEVVLAMGHDYPSEVSDGIDVHHSSNLVDCSIESDPGVADVLQYLRDDDLRRAEFKAVCSEKKRNPPYLIKDSSVITTKNNEPIKFCLEDACHGDVVTVSMRYLEEKFKNNPVLPCKLHKKELGYNFELSPSGDGNMELCHEVVLDHPTVRFTLNEAKFDAGSFNFSFYMTILCLNSCHKENGKKMDIIFKLYNPPDPRNHRPGCLITERHFILRACKNVKRDFKEAFQNVEVTSENQKVAPESFLYQEEAQKDPSVSPVPEVKQVKRAKVEANKVPCVLMTPEKVVQVIQPPLPPREPETKFYIVRWPTLQSERNGLENISLLGGKILSVSQTKQPIDEVEEEEDDIS